MAQYIDVPRGQFLDPNGRPLGGGKVEFFEAGTTTPKLVYFDAANTISAGTENVLDAGGFVGNDSLVGGDGGLWYGLGLYLIKVYDSSNVLQWTMDNINGGQAPIIGRTDPIFLENIENLRAVSVTDFTLAYVQGYYTQQDNGGGWFYYDEANTQDENQGTIIVPNGGGAIGRWKRIINDNAVRPEMFGAVPNDNTVNLSSQIELMIDWCADDTETYKRIYFSAGAYYIGASITFDRDIIVEFAEGVIFRNIIASEALITITCADAIINSFETQLVIPFAGPGVPTTNLVFNPDNKDREAFVEWWGAKGDTAVSDDEDITAAIAGVSDRNLVFSDGIEYQTSTTTDFSNVNLVFRNNSLLTMLFATFTFDGFDIEQKGNAFSFDQATSINFGNRRDFDINWFLITTVLGGTTISDPFYSDIMAQLTGSLAQITLNWHYGTYVFSTITIDSLVTRKLNHNILGATLLFNTSFVFGSINQCSEGISNIGSGVPFLLNKEIDVRWFGAISGTNDNTQQATNKRAIEYAIKVQVNGTQALPDINPYVTGHGNFYSIDEAIDFTVSVTPATLNISVNLKDLFITNGSGFVPVNKAGDDYMIAIIGKLTLDRVQFKNSSANNNNIFYCTDDFKCYDSTFINDRSTRNCIFNVGTNSFKFQRNTIVADDGLITTCDDVIISNNDFDVSNTNISALAGNKIIMNGNHFDPTTPSGSEIGIKASESAEIAGNHFIDTLCFIDTGSNNIAVSSNSFKNAPLIITNPMNNTIVGNNFSGANGSSYLSLISDTPDFVVIGLLVTSNSFISTSGPLLDSIRLTGSFADSGNKVVINNNNNVGMNPKATQATMTSEISASIFIVDNTIDWYSATVNIPIPSEIILPFAESVLIESATFSETYYSGGALVDSTEYAGLVSVFARDRIVGGSTWPNATFRLRWKGDLSGAGGDYLQKVYIKIQVSENLQ